MLTSLAGDKSVILDNVCVHYPTYMSYVQGHPHVIALPMVYTGGN